MPIVGDRNAVDDVAGVALGNRAFPMSLDGTTACVTDAGDRYAVDRELRGVHAFYLAAMRCFIT